MALENRDNLVIDIDGYILRVEKSSNSDYEFVTLTSTYKQTAASLFRWFRYMKSITDSENATENIMAMAEVFQSHKDELSGTLGEQIFIEAILMTCFQLEVDDSDLIGQVLNAMYNCYNSFDPLHLKANLGTKGRGHKDFLIFFLEHARKLKLKFDGERMIDVHLPMWGSKSAVYLCACLYLGNWKQMLIHLQYGARVEELYQDLSEPYYAPSSALEEILRHLVKVLLTHFIYPSLTSLGNDPGYGSVVKYCATVDADVKKLFCTLRILMRAIRRVRFGSLEIRNSSGRNIREIITHSAARVMIPKLSERYQCPEELKHICRWVIRKRLNENWQLPHGIQDLPIPRRLKRYINLLSD